MHDFNKWRGVFKNTDQIETCKQFDRMNLKYDEKFMQVATLLDKKYINHNLKQLMKSKKS